MKKIFVILLLTAIYVQAIELGTKSYTILINIPKLHEQGWDLVTIKAKGLKLIEEAGGQPFRLTHYTSSLDNSKIATYYFMISVVPKTQTEADYFELAKQKGFATIISTGNVICKQDRFGDNWIWDDWKVKDLPEDFYIEISTP